MLHQFEPRSDCLDLGLVELDLVLEDFELAGGTLGSGDDDIVEDEDSQVAQLTAALAALVDSVVKHQGPLQA